MMIDELIKIRHYLHRNPELSGQEKETSGYITNYLIDTKPDELLTGVGGYGIAAVYKGSRPGKNIGIRVDMDALPIPETSKLEYKSSRPGISHACGHDGHTTIGLGLAQEVSSRRNDYQGIVVIFFQPAEETGTGANLMLKDNKISHLRLDFVFALHNLPGYEKNALILRDEIFASSSVGVKIKLKGATSHAGHPEGGNNPVIAMTSLIEALNTLPQYTVPMHRGALVTVIHVKLGEVAFGTTPGTAVVMATLRAHYDSDLDKMKARLEKVATGIADTYSLKYDIEWVEYFPSVSNDDYCIQTIREAGKNLQLKMIAKDYPFSWSEDFAFFTKKFRGAMFGLGAGIDHPQVHNDNYDFPDELLMTGINMFLKIIEMTLDSA